jgi:deazaflavin-dependent oxidoreductase (nitroreductase family)
MARKGSLGVFRANDEEVEFRGVMVPQKLRVQSLGISGDPDMFAEFEISAGLAECTRFEYVRSQAGGRAVQTADLHEISDLQAYVEDAFLRYSRVIAEFRANKGEVGGQFQGAPLLLIHHRHRETGKEYVAPIFYLASDEEDVIYVFATLGGGLTDPNWYKNVIAAGSAVVEVGAEVYPVSATEVTGEQRDLVYAEQTRRYPVFGEYERLNAGVRVIPVVALRRG